MKTNVMGIHWKCPTENLQMNTHNICFCGEIIKIYIMWTPLLSGSMNILPSSKQFSFLCIAIIPVLFVQKIHVFLFLFQRKAEVTLFWLCTIMKINLPTNKRQNISRVDRKTVASQMVVFPKT